MDFVKNEELIFCPRFDWHFHYVKIWQREGFSVQQGRECYGEKGRHRSKSKVKKSIRGGARGGGIIQPHLNLNKLASYSYSLWYTDSKSIRFISGR